MIVVNFWSTLLPISPEAEDIQIERNIVGKVDQFVFLGSVIRGFTFLLFRQDESAGSQEH